MKKKTRNAILARLVWYGGAWLVLAGLYWIHTMSPYLTCLLVAVSSVEGVLILSRESYRRASW